jgi:putative endonuclease
MTSVFRGSYAEALAAQYLKDVGYEILQRNFRCAQGEIDLIAREQHVLCFVEVRSRTQIDQVDPFESITRQKQSRIIAAAREFLDNLPLPWPTEMRFDAVGIFLRDPPEIELRRGAFET